MVDALVAASTAPDVDRRFINVGSGIETSVTALMGQISEITDRSMEVLHSPAESGGVSRLCADITAAHKLLKYEPRVGLSEGLRLTLERDLRFQRQRPHPTST